MRGTVLPLSDSYRGALHFTLAQQVPLAMICLLLLDGGRMSRVCAIAMFGFWAAAALILARRPHTPAAGDLAFLRWGFVPLLALGIALSQFA
ncbi:MAG: hypothetical protein U0794_08075 [Isosphaeraceae bacterium]